MKKIQGMPRGRQAGTNLVDRLTSPRWVRPCIRRLELELGIVLAQIQVRVRVRIPARMERLIARAQRVRGYGLSSGRKR